MKLDFEQHARFYRMFDIDEKSRRIMIEILMSDEALWMLEGTTYDIDYTLADHETLQDLVYPVWNDGQEESIEEQP
jgi:hypothetical protein